MCDETFSCGLVSELSQDGERGCGLGRGGGRGSPGQRRRTDGQPAACQSARTELGTVPRLAASSELPGERMSPPYYSEMRVREMDMKKAASHMKLTCILRLETISFRVK